MEIDIETLGVHNCGLAEGEIKEYLTLMFEKIYRRKCYKGKVNKLYTLFKKLSKDIPKVISEEGVDVVYRWEVERFSNVLFGIKDS